MKLLRLLPWHLLSLCLPAHAADKEPLRPSPFNKELDSGALGYYPTREYATEPDIRSPETNWLQWDERCDDGLLYFLTPRGYSEKKPGPMILDPRGDLVWAHHFENKFGGQAYDLMVQEYQGEDYLTFWLGDDTVKGHGSGSYYMVGDAMADFWAKGC